MEMGGGNPRVFYPQSDMVYTSKYTHAQHPKWNTLQKIPAVKWIAL